MPSFARFAFRRAEPAGGIRVSDDGQAVACVGTSLIRTKGWHSAVIEPAISSAERCYAEWAIEGIGTEASIMIGVTDLDAALPPGQVFYNKPGSRLYYCESSTAWPGG